MYSTPPRLYHPMTQVTKANVIPRAATILSAYISNANAGLRYFQLFDKTVAPAGGDVPVYSFPVPAGNATFPGTLILDQGFFSSGKIFSAGISWAISTTFGTFTDSATASEHVVAIHYDPNN